MNKKPKESTEIDAASALLLQLRQVSPRAAVRHSAQDLRKHLSAKSTNEAPRNTNQSDRGAQLSYSGEQCQSCCACHAASAATRQPDPTAQHAHMGTGTNGGKSQKARRRSSGVARYPQGTSAIDVDALPTEAIVLKRKRVTAFDNYRAESSTTRQSEGDAATSDALSETTEEAEEAKTHTYRGANHKGYAKRQDRAVKHRRIGTGGVGSRSMLTPPLDEYSDQVRGSALKPGVFVERHRLQRTLEKVIKGEQKRPIVVPGFQLPPVQQGNMPMRLWAARSGVPSAMQTQSSSGGLTSPFSASCEAGHGDVVGRWCFFPAPAPSPSATTVASPHVWSRPLPSSPTAEAAGVGSSPPQDYGGTSPLYAILPGISPQAQARMQGPPRHVSAYMPTIGTGTHQTIAATGTNQAIAERQFAAVPGTSAMSSATPTELVADISHSVLQQVALIDQERALLTAKVRSQLEQLKILVKTPERREPSASPFER